MAVLPRFYTVFLSHFTTSLLIPRSYYEYLPSQLPKSVTLMGTCGKFWKVAMISRRDQMYFDQGWGKFVEDNDLKDGECLTFVYDGYNTFEVTIYNQRYCKETRGATQVEDIVSDETESESSDDSSSLDITAILGEEISDMAENDYESGYISAILGEDFSDEDSDSSPIRVDRTTVENSPSSSNNKTNKRNPIANPEKYLSDPSNVCYQTRLKKRLYELVIVSRFVKDYGLKFGSSLEFIDKHGKLPTTIANWACGARARRSVRIKKWKSICNRNKVKKEDVILCEFLLTSDTVVSAIKVHIVRGALAAATNA